ncbi:unnamed protein product [Symbiodinium sp. CCMP2592]|nr:unnamed protein product [Symbiodinium sp. CCMP2592]
MAKPWNLNDVYSEDIRLLYVPADGRCLFWTLLLHSLTDHEKAEWRAAERCNGWPAEQSLQTFVHSKLKLSNQCKTAFLNSRTPSEDEILQVLEDNDMQLYQFGTCTEPLRPMQVWGEESAGKTICVLNAGSVDGGGATHEHFTYMWIVSKEGLATPRPFETAEDVAEGWKGRAGKIVVSGEVGRGYSVVLQKAEERQYKSCHGKLGRKAIDLDSDDPIDDGSEEAVKPGQEARAFLFDVQAF